MTENISIIIILEFVAPFAILSLVLFIALLRGNKKNKKGLTGLLESVQEGEKDYQQKLLEFLKKSATSEEQLDELVQKFSRSRRAFFKQILTALNHNDAEQLQDLAGRFNLFSDLYHQLEMGITEAGDAEEGTADGSEIEVTYKVVKRENKRLKAEAHVSISALNGLFTEYASMFGEVAENSDEMTVDEVLEAMKKFTKGDSKPDGVVDDTSAETETSEDDEDIAVTAEVSADEDMDIEVEVDADADAEESSEPDWGEAFEESGDSPDEGTMEQFEEEQQDTPKEPPKDKAGKE